MKNFKSNIKCIQNASLNDKIKKFKTDVLHGLSNENKQIPSKYFYDTIGSKLFDAITKHPDYYLTGCELEIINKYKKELSEILSDKAFSIIELGPGEGTKTALLINQFLQYDLTFNYIPIDICDRYLQKIKKNFEKQFEQIEISTVNCDYFNCLKLCKKYLKERSIVLFFGSSIGNFDLNCTNIFLQNLWHELHHGDYVLIGFDLKKDIDILMRAYNDSAGITRRFNLNLLQRINNELGGNFPIQHFTHYPTYNINTNAMESYLVSSRDQIVHINSIGESFSFKEFEPIHVENSYKYSILQVEELAYSNGFEVVSHLFDTREFFVLSLWSVNKTNFVR